MADGKVIIKAQNDTKEGINSAKQDLLGFGEVASEVGKKVNSAIKVVAIVEGLKEIGKAAFDSFKEYGVAERYTIGLTAALDDNSDRIKTNADLIETLATKTLSSKDSIKALINELASLGKSDSDIDRISNAAVNLANLTGQDVQGAFTQLNGTFEGSVGKLGKLIPELNNLSKAQLENGDAIDIINQKLGKVTDAMSEGVTQKLKTLNESIGDLRENFGGMFKDIFSPMISSIQSIVDHWNSAITAHNKYNEALKNQASLDPAKSVQGSIDLQNIKLAQALAVKDNYFKQVGLDSYSSYLNIHPEFQGNEASGRSSYAREYNALNASSIIRDLQIPETQNLIKALKDTLSLFSKDSTSSSSSSSPSTFSDTSSSSYGKGSFDLPLPDYMNASSPLTASILGSQGKTFLPDSNSNYSELFNQLETITTKTYGIRDAAQEVKTGWLDALDKMGQGFNGLNGIVESSINILGKGMEDALKQVGKALVEGGDTWKNLGIIALNTLSQILSSIGEQLIAMAALKVVEGDYLSAGLATAGAAAAFVASGAIDASASNLGSASSSSNYSTSASGSSYNPSTTPQNLYYNFYQMAPVYGTGGEEELALTVRREFEKLGYYAH